MSSHALSLRAEHIFEKDLATVVHRTDRMFFWLLIGQWLAAVGLAIAWSPWTWIAQHWTVHQHLITAALLGGLSASYPLFCIVWRPGVPLTRHVIAVGQMLQSALLVHVTGGRIETHFHVFGSLALLAFYRDWRVLITASAVVCLDHVALGIWFPLSVYGVEQATFWRSAEHALWVVFEVVFLAMACRTGMRELILIAQRQAEIQQANEELETRVAERTDSLTKEVGERRQAQEALSQQTRVLQSILDNMGEAVIVADESGKFLLVNPAAHRLLATDQGDAPWQEWPAKYGLFLPDQLTPCPADQVPLVRALRGESCDDVELFLHSADKPRGTFLCCNARPIRGANGAVQGGVVVFHDLTERKHAEKALAERVRLALLTADVGLSLTRCDSPAAVLQYCSEAVVRHLDAAQVSIWTLDPTEPVLLRQASARPNGQAETQDRVVLGYSTIGKIAQDRKPFISQEAPQDVADGTFAAKDIKFFAGYPLIVGDRLLGVMATYGRETLTQATVGALGVIADSISLGIERYQAAQGLAKRDETLLAQAANRAKDEFLSRMSHELRTPLNAILGFGQLLEMKPLTDEQRECVHQINRGGKHLLGLINEVLDIARIEAGHMDLSPEPVRVAQLFQEVLELVQPLAARRGIQLQGDPVSVNGYCVLADNQKLKQVLLNLVSNAVKYNRDHGAVRLSSEPVADGKLRLTVTDTGSGIPAEKLVRLFQPFDRLGAEKTAVDGSGLGLALSKSLVELMGGALTVSSALGQGSQFSVELPQIDAALDDHPLGVQQAEEAKAVPYKGRTVLYIEDNLDNLRLVERILMHRPGIRLVTAMQGSMGMDLARQHRPDLILLDVHLPDLGGEQVLGRLRADPATHAIPVVVISADATVRQRERLQAAGAKDYLTKPIEVSRLLNLVDHVLQEKA